MEEQDEMALSRCVLFYNSKQKNYKDDALRSYCDPKNKENCRRRQLLVALGDLDSYVEVDQAVVIGVLTEIFLTYTYGS